MPLARGDKEYKPFRGGKRAAIKRKYAEAAETIVTGKKVARHDKHNVHLRTSDFPQRFNTTLIHCIGKPKKGKKRGSCVFAALSITRRCRNVKQLEMNTMETGRQR